MLVSDASIQNSKQSRFAWVITHNNTKLWQGVGIAPGPADDIYLGQAEVFGLIAGLTFLCSYIASYESSTFKATPLCCYCNNKGVITNVTTLLTPLTTQPNDTTNDDWDVYVAITKLALECYPLQPKKFTSRGTRTKTPNGYSHTSNN